MGPAGRCAAAALNELDAFPALLWRQGRPVLQDGCTKKFQGSERSVHAESFNCGLHDDNRHVAVFGRGSDLPTADYFQDYFSPGFAYDGGSSSSWGTRVAFREKLDGDVELTAVYSFGGALTPSDDVDGLLRDALRTAQRHSFGREFPPGCRVSAQGAGEI